jgi:hypothetical protein
MTTTKNEAVIITMTKIMLKMYKKKGVGGGG